MIPPTSLTAILLLMRIYGKVVMPKTLKEFTALVMMTPSPALMQMSIFMVATVMILFLQEQETTESTVALATTILMPEQAMTPSMHAVDRTV